MATFNGTNGNDTLQGGEGNDYLSGSDGNDILDGGAGNDHLDGGKGSDVYLFGRGSGQDTINDSDLNYGGGIETILLAADVRPDDVTLVREGINAVLRIKGTSDSLTIPLGLGYSSGNRVERIEFADGTVWDTQLTLTYSDADDLVWGAAGADILIGGLGNDSLRGHQGNDALNGGAGNDYLEGGDGSDILDGGAGNDSLEGGKDGDVYLFGRGSGQDKISDDDSMYSTAIDTVRLAADVLPGDVTLTREGVNVVLRINGTNDSLIIPIGLLSAGNQVERIEFADGTVWDTRLTLTYSDADDQVWGGTGADTVNGGLGNDTLSGKKGDDILDGGAGNDSLDGGEGNDILDGGAGNDSLEGWKGSDVYLFGRGSGQDTISDLDSSDSTSIDTVRLAPGVLPEDVTLTREGGNVVLRIIGTTDSLTIPLGSSFFPGNLIEQVVFADGTVWNTKLTLTYSDADDKVWGGTGADIVNGGLGNDTLLGRDGDDILDGGAGNDRIEAEKGNDILEGGTGNDRLDGGEGNDILDGGAGNDSLEGWKGSDVYLFGRGSGQDTISDLDSSDSTSIDTVRLAAGVLPEDVTLTREGGNVVLRIIGTTDSLSLPLGSSFFPGNRIERIEFADGTVWGIADLQLGTTENNILNGTTADSLLMGYDGSDALNGASGNDCLYGGAGDDALDGGAGNDLLSGGQGNDAYLFGRGAGQDIVLDFDAAAGNIDVIRCAAGILPDSLTYARQGDNLVLGIAGTSDSLTLRNWFVDTAYRIEQIQFADGSVFMLSNLRIGTAGDDLFIVDHADVSIIEPANGGIDTVEAGIDYTLGAYLENLTLTGSATQGTGNALDNRITANNLGNVLKGDAGNDTLVGGSGNDLLDGGIGMDVLKGGAGDDVYVVDHTGDAVAELDGEGVDLVQAGVTYTLGAALENLTLTGTAAIDGTGNALDNVLIGNNANNVLDGGNGNDLMQGGAGNDTYFIDAAGDTVVENADEGFDFVASTVSHALSDNVEYLNLLGAATINGKGNALNNLLIGNVADNVLDGGAGDDTLDGGAGSDLLLGGTGNDVYLFGLGYGEDRITDSDGTAGNVDTIRLGPDVLAADVLVYRDASNLYLSLNGSSDVLTVSGWFTDAANRVEQVAFADGTIWDAAVLAGARAGILGTSTGGSLLGGSGSDLMIGQAGTDVFVGRSGNDTLSGGGGDDTLDGGVGDDMLNGGEGADALIGGIGNDQLNGGAGNDVLNGGLGNDSYLFARGAGRDTVVDTDHRPANIDVAQFGTNISVDQLWFRHVGNDLEVSVIGTTDSITVQNWYSGNANHVEQFKTADGKVLADSQVENLVTAMSAFTAPLVGQTTLPDNYAAALAQVLAANWQ